MSSKLRRLKDRLDGTKTRRQEKRLKAEMIDGLSKVLRIKPEAEQEQSPSQDGASMESSEQVKS